MYVSKSLKISLQKLLGDREYFFYLNDVVIPELEQLVNTGKISPQELRKIREGVESKGIGILNPDVSFRSDITRNTYESDGWIAETTNELAPGTNVSHIIKKCSSKEDFKRSVRTHSSLELALKDTPYKDKLPEHFYAIKSKKIIDAPFVDGVVFSKELESLSLTAKESRLREVIADYVDFYKFLNKPELSAQVEFGQLSDFNEFFFSKCSKTWPLFDLYRRDIGNDLNAAAKHHVQGDLVPANIIHKQDGSTTYIDWGNAVRNGFIEFDIGTLLKKSQLTSEVEERLAKYAAELVYESPADRERSFVLYTKNMISQELVSAKRYLDRSRSKEIVDVTQRISLENMAVVNYNRAISRTRTAVARGFVSQEFLDVLVTKPLDGLRVVDDYSSLLNDWNPDGCMSQENLIPKDITRSEEYDPQKNLGAIKKSMFKERLRAAWYHGLKIAVAFGALALASGIVNDRVKEAEHLKEEIANRQVMQRQNDASHFYGAMYRTAFTDALGFVANGQMKSDLMINDPYIDTVAAKYDLSPQLLRNIMDANKCESGFYNTYSGRQPSIDGLNYADVMTLANKRQELFRLNGDVSTEDFVHCLDMRQNLNDAAQRLRSYYVEEKKKLDSSSSSLDSATYNSILDKNVLVRFFSPELIFGKDPKKDYAWVYGDLDEVQLNAIKKNEISGLAYSSIHGVSHAFDAGVKSVYLQKPYFDSLWKDLMPEN